MNRGDNLFFNKYFGGSNMKYGRLEIQKTFKINNKKMAYCICDCGKEKVIYYYNVTSGKTKSCGCLEYENRHKKKDLKNQVFGNLTALSATPERIGGCVVWRCQCICGKIVNKPSNMLLKGDVKSCGCLKDCSIDLSNQKFGKLQVLHTDASKYNWKTKWLCKCDCGNRCLVQSQNLLYGHTQSCGCLKLIEYRTVLENTVVECLNSKKNKNNTSGYKGVYRYRNKWVAYITFQKKRRYLGAFERIEEAAEARGNAEKEYFSPIIKKYKQV